MKFFVYIIKSVRFSSLYIGQTNNISERLKRHNDGRSISTKSKRPWELIFLKEFDSRSEAVKFESYLKGLKNKEYLLELINKMHDSSRPD